MQINRVTCKKKQKKWIWSIMILATALFFTSCKDVYEIEEGEDSIGTEAIDNPFESSADGALGYMTHGAVNPKRDAQEGILPFSYDGGEFRLDYSFQAEGKAETVGFLVFLNGKPQPYKVDDAKDYEYCHSFPIKEEQTEEEEFVFRFIPVDGKAGEILNLSIVSIYNPTYQPDMKNTTSYGWYHRILDNSYLLQLNVDAPAIKANEEPLRNAIAEATVSSQKVTKEFLQKDLAAMGWDGLTVEMLNDQTYEYFAFEGEYLYDNYQIKDQDLIHITYKMCGAPGVHYNTTFYVDHQPISGKDLPSFDTTLTKGDVWTADIYLDISKLGDFNTFYIMSVPTNAKDYPNTNAMVVKTSSILIYK